MTIRGRQKVAAYEFASISEPAQGSPTPPPIPPAPPPPAPPPTPPSVTINQSAGQADPTSVQPINFTVLFGASINDFTASDVTIAGTAGGTKVVVVTGQDQVFYVAVSGITTDGTVIATIAADRVHADGIGNTPSTSTDNTVTFTASVPVPPPPPPPPPPVPPPPPDPPPPPPPVIAGRLFPADNIWNRRIDDLPVHASSAAWVGAIGGSLQFRPDFGTTYLGRNNGIPVNVIAGNAVPLVQVTITTYASESDIVPGAGLPIPTTVRIEGDPGVFDPGADNHCLIVDTDTHLLHEFFFMQRNPNGSYTAAGYAKWDYTSNALRTNGWTSADAAGLPMASGLLSYDEVASGGISHALRFTVAWTKYAYLWPARHFTTSSDNAANRPPMGARFRLKASVNLQSRIDATVPPWLNVILACLKTYGMFLADNGGQWFLSGQPDPRWNDDQLGYLKYLLGSDFEAVDESGVMIDVNSGQATPP